MDEIRAHKMFAEVGAICILDHFVYKGGNHGEVYIDKEALFYHTRYASMLCRALAERFACHDSIHAVVGPERGGVTVAQGVGYHLTEILGHDVAAVYAEKEKKGGRERFVISRVGSRVISGRRVLVVDDVLNSGSSVKDVISLVRSLGSTVVGVGVLWNRGKVTAESLGVEALHSLISRQIPEWSETDCRLDGPCRHKAPINMELGHGAEFLARKRKKK